MENRFFNAIIHAAFAFVASILLAIVIMPINAYAESAPEQEASASSQELVREKTGDSMQKATASANVTASTKATADAGQKAATQQQKSASEQETQKATEQKTSSGAAVSKADATQTAKQEATQAQAKATQMTTQASDSIAQGISGTCSWDIDANGNLTVRPVSGSSGTLDSAHTWSGYADKIKAVVIEHGVDVGQRADWLFYQCHNLTSVDLRNLNTENMVSMSHMFYDCPKLTTINLSTIDSSGVGDMSNLFSGCIALTNLNLSGFSTANATNMSGMFENCQKLVRPDLTGFATSNVTNMSNMFAGCASIESLDLRSFNTAEVTDMSGMFKGCSKLGSVDFGNGFDTSQVANMSDMFNGCVALSHLELAGFDTSSVTNMNSMFFDCRKLGNLDLSAFDTPLVTDMEGMFYNCKTMTSIDLSPLLTPNLKNMMGMFMSCAGLRSIDLSPLDTSKVTDMSYLFAYCSSLTSVKLAGIDTSSVENMQFMFKDCSKLASFDASQINTNSATSMAYMFSGCETLGTIDVYRFSMSSLEDTSYMFEGCSKLTAVNLSNTAAPVLKFTRGMFAFCTSLKSIDFTRFRAQALEDISQMFLGCSALPTLDLSGFNTTASTANMSRMLEGCSALRTISVGDDFDYHGNAVLPEGYWESTVTGKLYTPQQVASSRNKKADTYSYVVDLTEATITLSKTTYTYDGTAKQPGVTVKMGTKTLVKGTDYRVVYEDNVNSGMGVATIYGMGIYIGAHSAPFVISKADLSNPSITTITLNTSSYTYDGTAKKPTAIVKVGSVALKLDRDYKVTYSSGRTKVGSYTVTISSKGFNCTGTRTLTFKIVARKLSTCSMATIANKAYTGSAFKPTPAIKYGSYTLKKGTDYTLTYKNNKNAGVATVTATGKGNFAGTKSATFKITFALSKATITAIPNQGYTGKAVKPVPTIKGGGKTLKNNTDFALTYKNNVKRGTATVTIKGKGCFTGTRTAKFKIAYNANKFAVSGYKSSYTYTGKSIAPTLTVKYGSKALKKGKDYTVKYASNKNAGTAKVTLQGIGNYGGTKAISYKIKPRKLDQCTIASIANKKYTGKAFKPSPAIKYGSYTLKKGTDYTIAYKNNKNAGMATVTITAKGNFTGKKTLKFKITCPITEVSYIPVANQGYTGKAIEPVPYLNGGGKDLKKGTDFTVSYKNNVKRGTASMVITGKGYFTGSGVINFKIGYNMDKVKVSGYKASYAHTGKAIEPSFTVKYGSVTLKKGKDYTATCVSNINVGIATVIIQGIGNYGGSKTFTFKIVPKATTISKATPGSKSVKVEWKKQGTQTAGYQIAYSTSSSFATTKYVTVSNISTLSKSISGLKANTRYYFKVRTYQTISAVKYYSSWSKVLSAKTKA